MQISVTIDDKKVLAGLLAAPKAFTREMRKEMGTQLSGVIKKSLHTHRFHTQSGNAESSLVSTVSRDGLNGRVEISTSVSNAPYARRLHEGGGGRRDSLGRRMTNKPDKWLYKAFRIQKSKIVKGLENAVNIAYRKAGL